MSVTLDKTRPGIELHMGALLREALAFQGIHVRVEKPYNWMPMVYLVAEMPGQPRVWITAQDCDGTTHYDVERAAFTHVYATVTPQGTSNIRYVYYGLDDTNVRPVAQAVACAAAVAAHFGLPVREHPDPFADVPETA